MVAVSGGVACILHRIVGQIVSEGLGLAGLLQGDANVVAFAVDGRIDFVSYAAVALVLGEADVVSSGTAPYVVSLPRKCSLPDAEVVAAGDHGDGLGQLVAEILVPPKQIQRGYGHGQVVFLVVGLHDLVSHRPLIVRLGDMPGRGS